MKRLTHVSSSSSGSTAQDPLSKDRARAIARDNHGSWLIQFSWDSGGDDSFRKFDPVNSKHPVIAVA